MRVEQFLFAIGVVVLLQRFGVVAVEFQQIEFKSQLAVEFEP